MALPGSYYSGYAEPDMTRLPAKIRPSLPTAALDEESEAALYKAFADKLPNATIVSIGHRSTLREFHDHFLALDARRSAAA